MTQKERMLKGMLYDPNDEDIMRDQLVYCQKNYEYNKIEPKDWNEKLEPMLKEMLAECGDGTWILPPFYANWGGAHVHMGKNVFANHSIDFVDDADIYIGDSCMFGPNCTIVTAGHPVEPSLRSQAIQYNAEVHIGKNVWCGANVTILPGVTIGDNCVIGAGAVVNKDIPKNSVVVGVPAKVIREINDHDREYYFKDLKIDLPIDKNYE